MFHSRFSPLTDYVWIINADTGYSSELYWTMIVIPGKWCKVIQSSIRSIVVARRNALTTVHSCQTLTTANTRLYAPRVQTMNHSTSRTWLTSCCHTVHVLALRTWNTPIHTYTNRPSCWSDGCGSNERNIKHIALSNIQDSWVYLFRPLQDSWHLYASSAKQYL